MNYILLIIFFLVIYLINEFLLKKKLFLNYSGQVHQVFTGEQKVPLSGGIYILLLLSYLFFYIDYLFIFFIFFIFLIGFFSDLNTLSSTKLRFLIQLLIVGIFVYILDISITSTKIPFLDFFLTNRVFSVIFTIFCLLIVVNGTNFIDGLNGLVLGYYSTILLILTKLEFFLILNFEPFILSYFFLTLIYLYFLNICSKMFLGDSGAYLLGLSFSILLIIRFETYQNFSPFFIVLLLWMPCFENLFSIIRKFSFKVSPTTPDNNHLHQLIFFFFKKIFKIKSNLINNLSSLIIIFYNLIIFYLGSLDIYNTKYQILLISINILNYLIVYNILFRYKNRN